MSWKDCLSLSTAGAARSRGINHSPMHRLQALMKSVAMRVNAQVLPGTTKDTRMAAVLPLSGAAAGQFIVMLTRGGWIKKTPMAEFADERAPKRNGKIAMKVEDGDELVRGTYRQSQGYRSLGKNPRALVWVGSSPIRNHLSLSP